VEGKGKKEARKKVSYKIPEIHIYPNFWFRSNMLQLKKETIEENIIGASKHKT
jgi:hypothetical protein